ncbi:MAG: ABC transporter ATP-binding protein [Armatimonadota bacterium]|nr:ABC transporter ATP-binding protein [Armatimonadota bacterium]MDR5703236.1 ABC transporter ATP-binding protein [Armatimonadota bacterium]MDR7433822.1 ABC transporter ATP-binding protein [Armatimonadota bacterium]
MLRVENVVAGYQEGIDVLTGVTLEAPTGQITAVIGPNGAGKSTLLRTIFGLLTPRSGRILFQGEPIQGLPSHLLKQRGIGYVPQSATTFPHLTVEENLLLGCWLVRQDRHFVRERLEWAYAMFPALAHRRRQRATVLSGGMLRMLTLAKEMVVQPALLLVDEPTTGLAPKVAAEVYDFLATVPSLGTTVLLVDQNIASAVQIARTVYLLEMGQVRLHGPQEVFTRNLREIVQRTLIGT